MDKLTLPELKNFAKMKGLKGYSLLRKKDLIEFIKKNLKKSSSSPIRKKSSSPIRNKLSFPISKKSSSPTRKKSSSPTHIVNYLPYVNLFLRHGFKLEDSAATLLNRLLKRLDMNLQKPGFVEKLGYLGEAAVEMQSKNPAPDAKLSYIVGELVDLINYSLIERHQTEVTVPMIERIISNDYDLAIAFE